MKNHEKWLYLAERDVEFAKVAMKEQFLSHCCFLSHQGAEKALKAFLILKVKTYPKSHQLPQLLSLCAQTDKRINALIKPCEFLNHFYMPTRYPDIGMKKPEDAHPSKKRTITAMDKAAEILKFVKELIAGE